MHGGMGNGDAFDKQLEQLANDLGPLVQFVCATAPQPASSSERLWIGDADKQGPESVGWWQESVTSLERLIEEEGPFDGLLGYSMGSAAAFALLATVPEGTFRFAVLCCGYVSDNNATIMGQLEERRPLRTPTLHCHGRADYVIPGSYSKPMLDYFEEKANELCEHPGGHDVPRDANHVGQLATFLLRFVKPGPGTGSND